VILNSKILDVLFGRFLRRKDYVFRFDEYDGTEENIEVYDGQVVEYELINQGNTIVRINGGMDLQPSISGLEPVRWRGVINYNEMDVSVYRYEFIRFNGEKICSGRLATDFSPCAGVPLCEYEVSVFVDGTIINTPFNIECTMTTAQIQTLWDANKLPFNYIVTWDFTGAKLTFDISGTFPDSFTGLISVTITGTGISCQPNTNNSTTITCELVDQFNRLLVISKVKASLKNDVYLSSEKKVKKKLKLKHRR